MDTCGLVIVLTLELLQSLSGADVGYTTTWKITFLHRGAGGVESILNPVLFLLHLDLGTGTYIEHSDSSCQFAKSFLKFLLVVVRSGVLNLLADLGDSVSDSLLVTGTTYDCGVVLCDGDFLSLTEHVRSRVLKCEASFL